MNTDFRDFMKEIASWCPFGFYKNHGRISRFPDTEKSPNIVSFEAFAENRDALADAGIPYDFTQDFFANFQGLFWGVDLPALFTDGTTVNSEYADTTYSSKDVYLSTLVHASEKVLYSFNVKGSTDVFQSIFVVDNSSNIYMSAGVGQSHNIFYSKYIVASDHIWLSLDLVWCSECVRCYGLRNKSYCIDNIEYAKEEYFKKKEEILLKKQSFLDIYQKILQLKKGESFIHFCEDIENGNYTYSVKNGRNILFVWGKTEKHDIYDTFVWGVKGNFYGVHNCGMGSENLFCCCHGWNDFNVYYSYFLESGSFCLGCIGLKNKSYCILNKQYTKEEWYELADKIFAQMDQDGILGNFFPGKLNPFYFNDTMAYLIDDSFTKEEVEREGYLWRDEAIKVDIPEGADIIHTSSRPSEALTPDPSPKGERGEKRNLQDYQWFDTSGNWEIKEEILKKVIRDEKGNFYKIVPMELEFLRKHSLPLPEIHWLERIKMGFRM